MVDGDDLVFLNGRLVLRGRAQVSAFDRGFLYGDGFFETTRVHNGVALLLADHLRRLGASCRDTGFGRPPEAVELREDVQQVIDANRVQEGYLRITVTRGRHEGSLVELAAGEPTVLIEARPMELPAVGQASAVTLARARWVRPAAPQMLRHKSLSYQGALLALAQGRAAGADEVYFVNSGGLLTEGAISNLFFVLDDEVCTPAVDCGLLPGVTRAAVLGLCERESLQCREGEFRQGVLRDAREVFCTNSLRGVMPVAAILEPRRQLAAPGPLTSVLQAAYAALVEDDCRTPR